MKILSDNDYMTVKYDEETQIFEYQWKSANEDLEDEGYQTEQLRMMHYLKECNPSLVIANTKHSKFTVHIEMQDWLIQNVILKAAAYGMKKLALIVSEDFITQISVEQSIDDAEEKPFITKYFDNLEEGRTWLKTFL